MVRETREDAGREAWSAAPCRDAGGGTGARGRGLIRGIFVVAAAWPWTFDRFREEMTKPRLSDFEMRWRTPLRAINLRKGSF
jgi:hypothetical protein